ncbi:MAG: 2-amino-4-hydroxy-6-hydroxymethyldihydropteridine diphosphokinase [Neisseriales bacterium]|nr:MAG: 2-amino-4-hydroxy-6-hydroxymethyldihydropteridine diphosphokinase [Neisseriales bacterium]
MGRSSINPIFKKAYLGLGSNLNDPIRQVKAALATLADHPKIRLMASSSFYLTKPVGYLNQPDFINAVAIITTSLMPYDLLKAMLRIEEQFGRKRTFRNAPRILDIDLLWYQDVVCADPILTLPHPRLAQRAFVLLPLMELDPDLLVFPNRTLKMLLARVECEGVMRIHDIS